MRFKRVTAVLLGSGLAYWLYSRHKLEKNTQPEISTCTVEGSQAWDEVDQASWESFPASDPPGWGQFS